VSRETSLSLENGGFTQLDSDGAWRTTPEQYAAAVHRYRDEIGNLQWAAYAYVDVVRLRGVASLVRCSSCRCS
jgi:hypothetical protein